MGPGAMGGRQIAPGALITQEGCGHLGLQATVVPGKQAEQFGHQPSA